MSRLPSILEDEEVEALAGQGRVKFMEDRYYAIIQSNPDKDRWDLYTHSSSYELKFRDVGDNLEKVKYIDRHLNNNL